MNKEYLYKLRNNLIKNFIHDCTIIINENKLVECIYSALEGKDKKIIIARYGLETGMPQTSTEVAKALNLSQSRVTQIEQKALKRLSYLSFYYVLQDGKSESQYTLQQLLAVSSITPRTYSILVRNGINTIEKLRNLKPEELKKIKSIGEARCKEILAVQELVNGTKLNKN